MNKHIIYIVFIGITLILPGSAFSESGIIVSVNSSSNSVSHKHKTPNPNHTENIEHNYNDKKILIEDSRGLSAFFMLGIIINIVMILTFGWWFSKEWRRKK